MPLTYIKTPEGHFSCPNCGIIKRLQSTMHYHMKNCTGLNDCICQHCNLLFYTKQGLNIHMQMRHKQEEPVAVAPTPPTTSAIKLYSCPFPNCTFKPSTKGNRRVHCMRIHLADLANKYMVQLDHGDLHCTLCESDFTSSTHYYYHAAACMEKRAEADLLQLPDTEFRAFMEIK